MVQGVGGPGDGDPGAARGAVRPAGLGVEVDERRFVGFPGLATVANQAAHLQDKGALCQGAVEVEVEAVRDPAVCCGLERTFSRLEELLVRGEDEERGGGGGGVVGGCCCLPSVEPEQSRGNHGLLAIDGGLEVISEVSGGGVLRWRVCKVAGRV